MNAEVDQITTSNGKATGVRLKSGEHIAANLVVSNADSAWTYKYLLSETVKRKWTERRIDKAHYSNGLFVWYFGTKKQYPDIPHHSIILGPRYKGLLTDIFKHKKPTEDFSLYLHRPRPPIRRWRRKVATHSMLSSLYPTLILVLTGRRMQKSSERLLRSDLRRLASLASEKI